MPTEIDEALGGRLTDILDLITGGREPAYRFEREIRLFQFQTWIYFPDQAPEMQRLAGLLAAAKFLEFLERTDPTVKKSQRGKAATYARLFVDPTYSELFDATVGNLFGETRASGFGWLRHLRKPPLRHFDEEAFHRIEQSDPVWKMIDYQFRRLDHSPTNPKLANIARAQVYIWKDKDQSSTKKVLAKPLSGKTIRVRWSKLRASAVFIYVDRAFDFRFYPRDLANKDFVHDLEAETYDVERTIRYLSTCAYVGRVLAEHTDLDWNIQLPEGLKELRPATEPLTSEDYARLDNYKDDVGRMKDN